MIKLKVIYYVSFDKKFIPQQIKFLNKNFASEVNQTFFVAGEAGEIGTYLKGAPTNVVAASIGNLCWLLVAAHKADRIVFNGLFDPKIILMFAVMPWLLRKAIWLPWGGDLYWRQTAADTYLKALFLAIKGIFVRRLYAIATPTFGDYEAAINWYGDGPKYINAGCNIFNFKQSDLNSFLERKNNEQIFHIQVGNSGDPTNDHLGALEFLSRFLDEDVQIHVPLSYGSKNYSEKIIEKGRSVFGEKFIPVTKFMPSVEYNKHLANINILVFNHRRQQGFGNLVILLYLGTKVFIRREVSIWHYLTEEMGCIISATDDIEKLSFQQFIEHDLETVKHNRSAVAHLFNEEWQRQNWSNLYFC